MPPRGELIPWVIIAVPMLIAVAAIVSLIAA